MKGVTEQTFCQIDEFTDSIAGEMRKAFIRYSK